MDNNEQLQKESPFAKARLEFSAQGDKDAKHIADTLDCIHRMLLANNLNTFGSTATSKFGSARIGVDGVSIWMARSNKRDAYTVHVGTYPLAKWNERNSIFPPLKAGGYNFEKIVAAVFERVRIARVQAAATLRSNKERGLDAALALEERVRNEIGDSVATIKGTIGAMTPVPQGRVIFSLNVTVTPEQAKALAAAIATVDLG